MPLTPQMRAACPAPALRRATGGKRAHFTASRALSTSSTVGIMTPSTPMSVACWMCHSCASGSRIMGMAATCGHAAIIASMSLFQRAVLHFEPGVVVVFCRLAIPRNIERRLREAEDLLAFPEFLYDGVVELRFGGIPASRLSGRRYDGKRKTENYTNDHDRRSHHGRPPGTDVRTDCLGQYIPARDEKKRGQGGQSQSGGGRKRPQPSTGMRSWRSLRLYEKPV